jgi:hypothetical protein
VGTPEEVALAKGSYTGEVLAPVLGIKRGRPTRPPAVARPKPKRAKTPKKPTPRVVAAR